MVEYLETYAAHFDLEPRFEVTVETVRPDPDGWIVQLSEETDKSDMVVFATGLNGIPFRAPLSGLDHFTGKVSEHHAPGSMASQRVLVAGFGNSGG